MNNPIKLARMFAYGAHLGQKYGATDYVTHLDHVADVLRRFRFSEDLDTEVFLTGYLHDTLEDTKATFHHLAMLFSPRVAFLVDAVTDQPGKNRAERHVKTHPRIVAAGEDAIVVKLADRIANVETSVRGPNEGKLAMYRKEYATFKAALNAPHLRFDRFGPQAKAMWEHLDNLLAEPVVDDFDFPTPAAEVL